MVSHKHLFLTQILRHTRQCSDVYALFNGGGEGAHFGDE